MRLPLIHKAVCDSDVRRICAITLARIKVTTDISGQNAQMQYAMMALLTCLEALLGVMNACLPVMKPIYNKLRETRALAFLSTWNSTWFAGRRSHVSRSTRNPSSSGRKQKSCPGSGRPRGVVHKSSHSMLSQDMPSDIGSATSSGPTSPRMRITKPHLPSPSWIYNSLEEGKSNAIHIKTDWRVDEQRASEDKLPMHPPRRQSGRNDTE